MDTSYALCRKWDKCQLLIKQHTYLVRLEEHDIKVRSSGKRTKAMSPSMCDLRRFRLFLCSVLSFTKSKLIANRDNVQKPELFPTLQILCMCHSSKSNRILDNLLRSFIAMVEPN
jgi:hypothetical protein